MEIGESDEQRRKTETYGCCLGLTGETETAFTGLLATLRPLDVRMSSNNSSSDNITRFFWRELVCREETKQNGSILSKYRNSRKKGPTLVISSIFFTPASVPMTA